MVPRVWLYKKDLETIRVVQRDADTHTEIVVIGAEGLRRQQLFASPEAAAEYQRVLQAEIVARGYELAWDSQTHTQ
jgi:hypothetical protein